MEDRAAIGAGLESGLCQARIARALGRSPSVISREIKRNVGADGCYRGGEAGRMAARRRARPKERGQREGRPWSHATRCLVLVGLPLGNGDGGNRTGAAE